MGASGTDSDPMPPLADSSADPGDPGYLLLNDLPTIDDSDDLLGTSKIAFDIASVVLGSRASSPFVLAIDAGWGMGKSALLHQIEARLSHEPEVETVYFNAWTAESDDALEGLIKSVLLTLDESVVRKGLRRLTRRRVIGVARVISLLLGRFFGLARVVDEAWEQFKVDARARNEMRDLITEMLADWRDRGPARDQRLLAVFIDDLDRCADDVVVKVCEAVKLYLDAPGLVFVLACDQSALARNVAAVTSGGVSRGRAYLEKIVQVVYRLPLPEEPRIKDLVRGYAERSGTAGLIDETVTDILAKRAGRNPRRIKRLINSFVLEHRLDPGWSEPPLGSAQLITAILLQHLYGSFYDLLRQDVEEDPVGEFLDYVEVCTKQFDPADEEWWATVRRTFERYRLPVPEAEQAHWIASVERLDRRLPEDFPAFARDATFVALLRGIGDADARRVFRARLGRRPLGSGVIADEPGPPAEREDALATWQIVCIDDDPGGVPWLVELLERMGARVRVHSDPDEADQEIRATPPDAIVSDITRGGDREAGFDHIGRLRSAGYDGPVVFFTGRVTPDRRRRATELRALDIVTTERGVIDALVRAATARRVFWTR